MLNFSSFYFAILALFLFCPLAYSADFTLKSKTLQQGQRVSSDQVFNGFGCSGGNISPDLEWSNAPAGTKAFAITAYDPDAPTGSGWWHWVVFNIPASTTRLELGASSPKMKKLPKGTIQSQTDFGKTGYGGPCPPEGDAPHHYFFRVYALKDKLPLNAKTPAAQVGFYLNRMKLAEAEIMVTYQR